MRAVTGVMAIGILACSGNADGDGYDPEVNHSRIVTHQLTGEIVNDTSVLALPTGIAVLDEFIVIPDAGADSMFHVLSRPSGEYLGQVGRRGGGPGEFGSAWSLDRLDAHTLMVYDFAQRRLTTMGQRDWTGRAVTEPWQVNIDAPGVLTGVTAVDGRYVAVGMLGESRIAWLNEDAVFETAFGALPAPAGGAPVSVLQHAYQSSAVASPNRTHIAVLERHSGFLTVVEPTAERERRIAGPFPFEPVIAVRRRGDYRVFEQDETLRFGYVAGAADDERLYALFSGRLRGAFGSDAVQARFIHVFDWNGAVEAVWILDRPVLAIAKGRTENEIFGVQYSPTPSVVRFVMPRESPVMMVASSIR